MASKQGPSPGRGGEEAELRRGASPSRVHGCFLEELGAGLRAYLAGAAPRLLAAGLAFLAWRNGAAVAASPQYRAALEALGVPHSGCGDAVGDERLALLGCAPPPRGLVVYAAGVDARRLRGLERLEARKLGPGIYAVAHVKAGAVLRRCYLAVSESGGLRFLEPPCPRRLLAEARELLGREASLRDFVDLVAAAMRVSRGEARRLVGEWATRLCVEARNGVVRLLD